MKKILLLFIVILLITIPTTIMAKDVEVQINGEIVNFKDTNGKIVKAQIINDRTMVPMRKIFEILGADIKWDAEKREVTATKNDTIIKLQIENNIAEKNVGGITEKIVLDSPPVIVNDRTLIPLRFVAESLEKQVAWDKNAYTAIIIDYSYFANRLKTNARALYELLNTSSAIDKNAEIKITRNYTDLSNGTNNNVSNIHTMLNEKTSSNEIKQNVSIEFSGTNDLMKDIESENWNSISYDATYNGSGISCITSNSVLSKMLLLGSNKTKTYSELKLIGTYNMTFEKMLQTWCGIEERNITINTFKEISNDFDKLCNLFSSNNTNTTNGNVTTYKWVFGAKSITYKNANIKYFDLTKLDNMIFDNTYSRIFNFINKNIFNYDLKSDNILYDTSNIELSGNISVDVNNGVVIGEEINILYISNNEYNEKIQYNISALTK